MCEYKEGCIFCSIAQNLPKNILGETKYNFALPDKNPITKGHTLIIPKSHFENFMENDDEYLKDAAILAKQTAKKLMETYPDIKGINYVSNQGAAAKQVIFHFHLHVIPRY